jgi:hypothetical protein
MQAGCSGEPATELHQRAVRDSAGIEIVESTAPIWTEACRWRLGDRPTLEIGAGLDGDSTLQFANVVGVHRLSSGAIAVVDAWAPGVLFFDSAGALLGRIGRTGTGPGEFPRRAEPRSFDCGGDTVFVVVMLQVAAYRPPAEYVRTFRLERPATIRACGAAGIIGQARYGAWRTETGVFTDSTVLLGFNADGTLRSVLDTLPLEVRNWARGPEGTGYARVPFSPALSVTVRDGMLATGFGLLFEIELRQPSGVTTRMLRVTGHERTVSSEDLDQFSSYVLNPYRGNEDERRRLEQRLEDAAGKPVPYFAQLRFDAEGNLWARAYDHLDAVAFYDYSHLLRSVARPTITEVRRWNVFSPAGRYLGAVDMPPNLTVYDIGSDAVLGVWRDELDIQYVRQYPLIKPRR